MMISINGIVTMRIIFHSFFCMVVFVLLLLQLTLSITVCHLYGIRWACCP